jgi:hypothetical protein
MILSLLLLACDTINPAADSTVELAEKTPVAWSTDPEVWLD